MITHKGHRLEFVRRGYGHGVVYTWVSVVVGDRLVSLGDPWPRRFPPMAEVRTAADKALARHAAESV